MGPYFRPMFELKFYNPNQVIFKVESSLDFPTNKKNQEPKLTLKS